MLCSRSRRTLHQRPGVRVHPPLQEAGRPAAPLVVSPSSLPRYPPSFPSSSSMHPPRPCEHSRSRLASQASTHSDPPPCQPPSRQILQDGPPAMGIHLDVVSPRTCQPQPDVSEHGPTFAGTQADPGTRDRKRLLSRRCRGGCWRSAWHNGGQRREKAPRCGLAHVPPP